MSKTITRWLFFFSCCVIHLYPANAGEGGSVLSDEIKALLTSESYIYVATRRLNGEWSTVAPVWFMFDGEAVYFTTAPSSHKAHRIHRGSPVRIWVGREDGPVFEGDTRIVKDRVIVERMSEVYQQKYWIARFGFFSSPSCTSGVWENRSREGNADCTDAVGTSNVLHEA